MAFDFTKIIGGKSIPSTGSGAMPVNVKIIFDPSVNKAVKDVKVGLLGGMGLIALGMFMTAAAKHHIRR
jgi:hypothetical protein